MFERVDARARPTDPENATTNRDHARSQEITFRDDSLDDGFSIDPMRVMIQPGTTGRVRVTWTPVKALNATYCGSFAFDAVGEAPVPMEPIAMKVRTRGVANARSGALQCLTNVTHGGEHGSSATKRPRDARLATRRSLIISPKKIMDYDADRLKQRRVDENLTMDLTQAPVARALQLNRASEDVHRVPVTSTAEDAPEEFQANIWVRQQELAFIAWLNHTIVVDDVGTMGDDAPSANRGGSASAREVRQTVRNKLSALYSYDDELGRVLRKTYRHVDNARLRLKTGETFMDDVALKEDFSRALSSYSTFWLRLGVEVIVGASVPWKRHADLRETQEECINALCRDHELELEFGTGHTPGAPPYAHGYDEALRRNILKRVLLLVFILDRCAHEGLPPSTPLLMRPHAALKRSEDILRLALQGSMYGEGDVIRNLSQCSYKLHYKQNPIREYDFRCTNLAVDLRDGVRLCRLMEVLNADVLFMSYDEKNNEWKRSLLGEAHFPCANRNHRIQNVQVALRAIKDQNVGLPGTWSRIKAEDIVDGHLEHTMGLLWALMMHYSAPGLLLPKSLDAEIVRLGGRAPDVKRVERLSAARRGASIVESPQCAMEARLFAWAKAACAVQRVDVNNLGSAFTDGRALCALIRTYAPAMVPKHRCVANAPLKLNDADDTTARIARRTACDNFATVSKALQALGGVPNPTFDIRFADAGDVESPDPRAVSGYLLFLSARLLLLRQQEVACVRVQRWWRWHRPNRPRFATVVKRWIAAATIMCAYARRARAVAEALHRRRAIVTMQAHRRGVIARRNFIVHRTAAVTIQAAYRAHVARLAFLDTKWAARVAQKTRRSRADHARFIRAKHSAIVIQSWYRTVRARKTFEEHITAALVIQTWWRGACARAEAKAIIARRQAVVRSAAIKIQAAVRAFIVRKQFLRLRWAVVWAQARAKRDITRRAFVAQKQAAVKIQSRFRGFLSFSAYRARSRAIEDAKRARARAAATEIQRHWRGFAAHREFLFVKWFVTIIQAYARGALVRRKYIRELLPARRQALDKMTKLEERKKQIRTQLAAARVQDKAAKKIQAFYRGHLARKRVERKRVRQMSKVTAKARREADKKRRAKAVSLKAAVLYNAAENIQRHVRGWLVRRALHRVMRQPVMDGKRGEKIESKIVVAQAYVRGWLARKNAVPKAEWIRKRLKHTTERADPRHSLRERAKQAAMLVCAPHNLKECVRGCTFFIDHWELSETCRNAVTSADVLHALMRNIRSCGRSAKQVPLLTVAYDLLELVASDSEHASTLADSRDCLNIIVEHMQMFRDRPSLLESAVNVVLALCENSNAHLGQKVMGRIESLMEIIRSNRTVHRRRAMSFAHQGKHDAEVEARDALLQTEQCLAALKKLNVLGA